MGRYIEIKKIKQQSNVYYYSVVSPDYSAIPMFFIGIDADKKVIHFYKDIEKKDEKDSIDITTSHYTLPLWLPHFLFYATVAKAKLALENNSYTEYISFQS